MADKLTLLELHLHAEDNEFESDMQFSSDIGDLLRNRLGLGSETDDEPDVETPSAPGPDAELGGTPATETTTDGGDTVQVDDESEGSGAVVEIDTDADLDDEADQDDESDFDADLDDQSDFDVDADAGGRSKGRGLLMLVLLVGLVLLARRYLGGDDIEDEFEEL